MTSKYQKGEISATTVWTITYEGEFRVKLKRKTQEENARGKLRGNLECGSAQPSLF
jgi:hypothetical protein